MNELVHGIGVIGPLTMHKLIKAGNKVTVMARGILQFLMWIMFKTRMGELAVSNHCRYAVTKMQFMNEKFEELRRKNSSFLKSVYDRLRRERTDWEKLHQRWESS